MPKRYAIVFAGQALGGDGWPKDRQMVAGTRFTESGHFIAPAQAGARYTLTTPLQSLRDLIRGLLDRERNTHPVQQDVHGVRRGSAGRRVS